MKDEEKDPTDLIILFAREAAVGAAVLGSMMGALLAIFLYIDFFLGK